jgi:hypothetical protein
VLCILSICLLILHLSVAICEICLLYFTYGVCLVLSLKPGVTVITKKMLKKCSLPIQ